MRTGAGVCAAVLICALLIAGCTSPTTSTEQTLAPTTQVPAASTPIQTFTIAGSTGGAGTLRVSILDVGQGDSILIQSPAGRTMLVDAGDTGAGARVVADLQSHGVTSIDAAVASHAHADHIGGYQAVLSRFPVVRFYDAGYPSTSAIYERMLTTIEEQNIMFSTPTGGQTIDLDPALRVDVLSPDGLNQGDIHDNMLVLRLSYGKVSFLLAGDMPDTLEAKLTPALRPTTVLKVGHHGSRTSSSAPFLSILRPTIAVISVGAGNQFGHPAAETLSRLQAVGAKVYRTDQSGTVTITTDGDTCQVTTEKTWPSTVSPSALATTSQQSAGQAISAQASPDSGTVAITGLDLHGEAGIIMTVPAGVATPCWFRKTTLPGNEGISGPEAPLI